jgi:LPS export ABC transporter protein LptC
MKGCLFTFQDLNLLRIIPLGIALVLLQSVSAFCLPAEVQISGFSVSEKGNEGYWWIKAAEASYNEAEEAELKNVSALFLDGDQEKVSVIGNRGRYIQDKSLLVLEGDVQIQTNSGYRLTTSRMEWNRAESTITSMGGVELTGTWLMVRGRALNYNIDSSTAVITGDVKTRWIIGARGL